MTTTESGAVVVSATTALPYPHLARATAGLRAELRHRLTGAPADWSTFTVTGLLETTGARGVTWFEYHGSVAAG